MKKRSTFKYIALLYLLALIIASVLPGKTVQSLGIDLWDKAQHTIAYGIAAILTLIAFADKPAPHSALFLFLLGIMLEVAQSFVPLRSFEWADMIANGLGVLVGYCLIMGWNKYRQRL